MFDTLCLFLVFEFHMRTFAHIVAEKRSETWSAWFTNSPLSSCGGMNADDAVSRLLGMYGEEEMDFCGLVTLESDDDDHVECLVPYRNRIRRLVWQSNN